MSAKFQSSYTRLIAGCVVAVLFWLLGGHPAFGDLIGAGDGTIYRLTEQAVFQEGCFEPCLCPLQAQERAWGTFKLRYVGLEKGLHTYAVEEVNWQIRYVDEPVRVRGSGVYRIGSPNVITVVEHRMELDLQIGDDAIEHFDSGWTAIPDFERVSITVSINQMFCWDRVFQIDALPVPDSHRIAYDLVAGSTFQRGCFDPCDCILEPELPMIGTFQLVPLDPTAVAGSYAVVAVDWAALNNDATDFRKIFGFGFYHLSPDPTGIPGGLANQMNLDLVVDDEAPAHFDSGLVPVGAPPPAIDVTMSINGMVCFDTVLHVVAELSGVVCGGFAGLPCGEGEYCRLPTGFCCCDFQGVCMPIPDACPAVWDPVCGCDGVTYGNECEADAAGMSLAHDGPCERVCEGIAGLPCEDGEFCKLPEGTCTYADVQGICRDIPEACPDVWDPVCGCDGVTYGNECEADAAATSLNHHGQCGAFDPGDVNRSGTTDVDDIICALLAFLDAMNCPGADIAPCGGNGIVDVDDILYVLASFAGFSPCPNAAGQIMPSPPGEFASQPHLGPKNNHRATKR